MKSSSSKTNIFLLLLPTCFFIICSGTKFQSQEKGQIQGLSPLGPVQQKITDPCAANMFNCNYFGGGTIICMSNEPEFVSLIKASLNDRYYFPEENVKPSETQAQRVEILRKHMPLLLEGLKSKNPCIQRSAICHIRITKDPVAIDPLLAFLKEHSWRDPVGCYALSTLAHVYTDKRIVPYMIDVISQKEWSQCTTLILDACSSFPYDHDLFDALIDCYENRGGDKSILQYIVAMAHKGAEKKEMISFFKRNSVRYDFGSWVGSLAKLAASKKAFDEIAAIYRKYYFDPKKSGECKTLYYILEKIGGAKFHRFRTTPLVPPDQRK